MANRRMFSKSIVVSSKFLRMPATSRLLYYDLGMAADDDGYCEWYPIIASTGAKEQDMQVLQANGFVQVFDENVLVIRDWKENNYLRPDRYVASKYIDIYKDKLLAAQSGIPSGNQMDTQVRLGKVSIGKDTPLVGFDEFWQAYPKKVGKTEAGKIWKRLAPSKDLQTQIMEGLARWKVCRQWTKDGGQFIPHASTFLNQTRWSEAPEAEISKPKVFTY